MWWIILLIILGLYLLYRIFVWLFGNWRGTLNQVITQYIAWKQMEPKYSNEEIFLAVLDHRYTKPNKDIIGLRKKMHERKNKIKDAIKSEVNNIGVNKYGLPMLIYTCLIIEENTYINQKKEPSELLNPIIREVIRQGFEKYC